MLKCCFIVSGLNAERKLNTFFKSGISIFNIIRQEKSIYFEVLSKDKDKVQSYLKNVNVEFAFNYIGLALFLEHAKKRIGVIIGVAVFLCMLFASSNIVMQINIQGNNTISTQEIVEVLKRNGFNTFSVKSAYNLDAIQNLVVDNFENIAFASAIIRGNTLIVSVKENVKEKKPSYEPLYAMQSGVITGLNIKRGTCVVSVGDVVQKGQIIIEPYEVLHGERVMVSPDAEVVARAYVKGCVEYDSKGFLQGRVGDEYIVRKMNFLGMNIPCVSSGDISILNAKYEVEVQEEIINAIVPIKITKTHYYKIGDVQKADYERDKDALEKQSQYLALAELDADAEIVEQKTQTIEVEGVYYITTYIEVKKNILSA